MNITLMNWTDEIGQKLQKSAGDDLAIIKRMVQENSAQLYQLRSDKTDLLMVARASGADELVVMCLEGSGLKDAGVAIIEAAKKQGFKTIRYHTASKAIQRLNKLFGFAGDEVERVYRYTVSAKDGQ